MTEAEWLACEDPEAMLPVIAHSALRKTNPPNRKREFFSAACCRLVWPWIAPDQRCRDAVERMETQFEVPIPDEEEANIWDGVKAADRHPDDGTPIAQMIGAGIVYDSGSLETLIAKLVCEYEFDAAGAGKARAACVAHLMREIAGNPFLPVTFSTSWRTDTAVSLACQMCDSRDFSAMPILADALQDAGCDSDDVLSHCRGPGPHVRGCWVVDLVLGKE